MNECEKYLELLSAGLDGELSENESRELKTHLETCADCRETLEALRLASKQASRMTEEPPETLKADIMKKLQKPAKSARPKLYILRYAALAAMLALVVFAAGRGFPVLTPTDVTAGPRTLETPAACSLGTLLERLESELGTDKSYAAVALITEKLPAAASEWKLVKETDAAEYYEVPAKDFEQSIAPECTDIERGDPRLPTALVIRRK